jgi:hypothetical protein
MQSEELVRRALDALASPREAFRSAVVAAVDEIGARIAAEGVQPEERVERARHELGAFGGGRIDSARFASIFGASAVLDPGALTRLQRAHATLRRIAEQGDALLTVRVAPGADLYLAVTRALAEVGRAFGAARDVQLARSGRGANGGAPDAGAGFGFRGWNRAERQIAPPLVVEVDGGDAQVAGLAELMNGRQKIALVLRGAAPPAPLARLATPGVLVMQTGDPADLDLLAAVDGPAIAAVVPEGCARFVHRPGPAEAHRRFEILHLPAGEPREAVGSFSPFQQAEELALLRSLATPPAASAPTPAPTPPAVAAGGTPAAPAAVTAVVPAEPADPAERLAAWLLRQADLGAGA